MNRGIYSTAAGMAASQNMMDLITHNLANASTNGFKQDGMAFSDMLDLRSAGANVGLRQPDGSFPEGPSGRSNVQMFVGGRPIGEMSFGPRLARQFTDFSVGNISATGNPLDLAIPSGEGFFGVQTPQGVRYTRDGAFTLTDGRLTTRQGFAVLDARGESIDVPSGKLEIGEDGSVQVDGAEVGTVAVYNGTFAHEGNNLYTGTNAVADPDAEIRSSALEGSNVNPVASMVSMVGIHRIFELSQRSISQQDELTQRLIQSLQDR